MAAKRQIRRKSEITLFALLLSVLLVEPAAAGRCGHSYPVDAPTTLSKVARACNVSLAALREANPGSDPSNVRPGEHLAVPEEGVGVVFNSYPEPIEEEAEFEEIRDRVGSVSRSVDTYRSEERFNAQTEEAARLRNSSRRVQRVRYARDVDETVTPIWLREEVPTGGHYSLRSDMSFQQYAALRIRTASIASNTDYQFLPPIYEDASPRADSHVLPARFTTRDNTRNPRHASDANLLSVPKVDSKVFGILGDDVSPKKEQDSHDGSFFALSGKVLDVQESCLVVKSFENEIWRVHAPEQYGNLTGEKIAVWGEPSNDGNCGNGATLSVQHTVYAEQF